MSITRFPNVKDLEAREKKVARREKKKRREELREFILLVVGILVANFLHDGIMFLVHKYF